MAKFLLLNHTGDYTPFNSEPNLIPFLIIAPNQQKMVRVIYGISTGLGIKDIQSTPLDHHILALQGDYLPNQANPNVLSLPFDTLHCITIKTPVFHNFIDDLAKEDTQKKLHWYEACNLPTESDITYAVPIPTYLVYSVFNQDATIIIIFECLCSVQDMANTDYWLQLALNFLMSSVVRTSTTRKETNARIDSVYFTGFPLEEAIQWKEQQLQFLFPSILKKQALQPPPLQPHQHYKLQIQPFHLNQPFQNLKNGPQHIWQPLFVPSKKTHQVLHHLCLLCPLQLTKMARNFIIPTVLELLKSHLRNLWPCVEEEIPAIWI